MWFWLPMTGILRPGWCLSGVASPCQALIPHPLVAERPAQRPAHAGGAPSFRDTSVAWLVRWSAGFGDLLPTGPLAHDSVAGAHQSCEGALPTPLNFAPHTA